MYSAGGGGTKSQRRKDVINVKNERLEQQRRRRRESEQKLKLGEATEIASKGPQKSDVDTEDTDIHPSRRSRIPGGGMSG